MYKVTLSPRSECSVCVVTFRGFGTLRGVEWLGSIEVAVRVCDQNSGRSSRVPEVKGAACEVTLNNLTASFNSMVESECVSNSNCPE